MGMILNLTQHKTSPEQSLYGVFDLPEGKMRELRKLLTFEEIPSKSEMRQRAEAITEIAKEVGVKTVMCGGAPYFMFPLEWRLASEGFTVLYAFSKRETVEEEMPDGSVVKRNVFRHEGFVSGMDYDNAVNADIYWKNPY